MLQAFIIVFREAFEGFLIVAIILSYLRKSGEKWLEPAVYWGIAASVLTSAFLGSLLRESVSQSFWEGVLGIATIVMVGTLVIQMWRIGPRLKSDVEHTLVGVSSRRSRWAAVLGVFLFTVLMITREGMEMAVMLIQVREGRFITGILLGIAAAVALSYAWTRFSYAINLKRFFQVTAIFLLLFLVQVGIYSIHEFSEARVIPYSQTIHTATEPFTPTGLYGKWFSLVIALPCIVWLLGGWISDRLRQRSPREAKSA